jgi:dehydrogenase/reductase SDR family protein 12
LVTLTYVIGSIDILVNNGGALLNDYKLTPDGLESSFAANTLGTYYLTTLVIPSLKEGSRIITVSSGGMLTSRLSADVIDKGEAKHDGVKAYSLSKRAQVELTNFWAKANPNLHIYSMHPGWCDTPGSHYALLIRRCPNCATRIQKNYWIRTAYE